MGESGCAGRGWRGAAFSVSSALGFPHLSPLPSPCYNLAHTGLLKKVLVDSMDKGIWGHILGKRKTHSRTFFLFSSFFALETSIEIS